MHLSFLIKISCLHIIYLIIFQVCIYYPLLSPSYPANLLPLPNHPPYIFIYLICMAQWVSSTLFTGAWVRVCHQEHRHLTGGYTIKENIFPPRHQLLIAGESSERSLSLLWQGFVTILGRSYESSLSCCQLKRERKIVACLKITTAYLCLWHPFHLLFRCVPWALKGWHRCPIYCWESNFPCSHHFE